MKQEVFVNKIEAYLYFLLGVVFKYSISDKKTSEIINHSNQVAEKIAKLRSEGVLNYDLRFAEHGQNAVTLFEIDENKLEAAVLERMKFGRSHLIYWLQQPVEILKLGDQYALVVLNDMDFNSNVIYGHNLSFENIVFEDKSYIKIKMFSLQALRSVHATTEKARLKFIKDITGLDLKIIPLQDNSSVFQNSSEHTEFYLYKSSAINISDSYCKWLKSELDWLQDNKFLKYKIEISSNECIFYFKNCNYKMPNELVCKNAVDIEYCLHFLLGVNFIPALSGRFFAFHIKPERLEYVRKKLSECKEVFSYQSLPFENTLEITDVDCRKLLEIIVKKLSLGEECCQVIFNSPKVYIRLNSGSRMIWKEQYIFPHLFWEIYDINFNNFPEYKKLFSIVLDESKKQFSATWFDEYQLQELAVKNSMEQIKLLQKIFDLPFERTIYSMEDQSSIVNIDSILEKMKGLGHADRLPDKKYDYEISYRTYIPTQVKPVQIALKLQQYEDNGILEWIDRPRSWILGEKNPPLTDIKIVIRDIAKLKLLAESKEKEKLESASDANYKNCLVM